MAAWWPLGSCSLVGSFVFRYMFHLCFATCFTVGVLGFVREVVSLIWLALVTSYVRCRTVLLQQLVQGHLHP